MLRHRRKPVVLEPHLDPWSKTQFRSPDLEYYGGQYVQERMLRPTKVDAIPLSTKQSVIDDIRDCRTWYGYEWKYQNRDRRLDRARSQGQVYYGLAIERVSYGMPGEPSVDDDDDAETALKKRNDYFMESGGHAFKVDPVHPLSVMFAPIHDLKVFIEEGMISLYELRKMKNADGATGDMSEKGVITFHGDKEPLEQWNDRASMSAKKIHYYVYAWEDEDTEQWHIAEYVFPPNEADGSGEVISDEIVPFNRCPYFVIPSGEYDALATDPHLAFRPRMYPLYVDINDLNQVESKIWAYAVRATNSVAVTLDGQNPELLWEWLETHFGQAEGDGAQRGMVLPVANNGPGEWPVVPKLVKMPFEVDTALMTQRQGILDSIKNHQPNRFQTGNLGKTEATEMKATTNANAWEASALPIEQDLGMQDSGTRAILEAFRSAICFWPEGKIYPWLTTGAEPLGALVSGQSWASRGIGDSGFASAKKMGGDRPNHEIVVRTRNQTLAEEQIEQLMAAQDETNGVITRGQHLERRGIDDIQKQNELLEADQEEKDDAPHVRQLLQQTRLAIFMARSGANQAALMGLPAPQPSGLAPEPTYPGPVEAGPPRSGSGPPVYKPSFMENAPQEQPPPANNVPHGIQPSPVGFGQGSSPGGNEVGGR